jgi:DNA-binding GntR family transcriptional regulator
MRAQEKSCNAQAYFPLNVEFHDLLARAARNSALLANYRGIVNQLDLYRRATLSRSTDNISISTRDHEAIVAAVATRDESLAERLMSEHVLQSRQRLHRALGLPDAQSS